MLVVNLKKQLNKLEVKPWLNEEKSWKLILKN